jgi:amino acid transporter
MTIVSGGPTIDGVEWAATPPPTEFLDNGDKDYPTSSPPPHQQEAEDPHRSHEKLGVASLAIMVFYSVSGGPFGVEASVRSAGHFYTLVGFILAPLVWSLQEAAMTAELGAALPESAGGVAWVETAWGPLAGWMTGYLGWVSGATDNAIYPVLFLDYLLQAFPSEGGSVHPVLRFFLLAGTSITLAYFNWRGLAVVGRMSIVICVIAMSPFIILSIVGVFHCDPSRWFELPSQDSTELVEDVTDDDVGGGIIPNMEWGGVLWRPFLNNLFWNLNSFDAVGSLAADVEDPGRAFPTAMFWGLLLTVLGYFIPLLVAFGASDAPQQAWVDGYFEEIASTIVGPWLGAWTVFAAGISNIALFQAELSADAFQLMGMSERGFIPKVFSRRSQHGTPTYGILLGTVVIVVMGVSHLGTLIEMLNFNYSIAVLLEYSAFVKLRMARPDLHRPWRVPLGTMGCILALVPTFLLTFIIMGLATYTTW